MNRRVAIRQAEPDDARVIATINVETWLAIYRGILHDEHLATLSIEKRTEDWQKIIAAQTDVQLTFVATDEADVICGYCGGGISRIQGFDAELYALYVHPEAQGYGYGKYLVEHFLDFCKRRKWRTVCVLVLQENSATGFYEYMQAQFFGFMTTTIGSIDYEEILYAWSLPE